MPINDGKPRDLKLLLNELIESQGWAEKFVELKLPDIWVEVVGDQIASVTKIRNLINGELLISTESSTWRSELKLRSSEIINKLNEKLGKNLISSIKIR